MPARTAVDWSTVSVWWGDERYLPAGDPDRNDTQNDAAGLDRLGLDPANVHRVPGPDASESAEDSARARTAATVRGSGGGEFDVMILGVGPDGHVASLFPGHPAQLTTDAIAVAVHDSPKPPPDRVSLTFECLSRSDRVWFLVAGADKAQAVRNGVEGAGPEQSSRRPGARHPRDDLAGRRRLCLRPPRLTHPPAPDPPTIAAHVLPVTHRRTAAPFRGLRARRLPATSRVGGLRCYWMSLRSRSVASASSRMALPSASERRSFT